MKSCHGRNGRGIKKSGINMLISEDTYKIELPEAIELTEEANADIMVIMDNLLMNTIDLTTLWGKDAKDCFCTNHIGYVPNESDEAIVTAAGLFLIAYNANMLGVANKKFEEAIGRALVEVGLARYKTQQ